MNTPSSRDEIEQKMDLIGLYDKDNKLLFTTSYITTMALNLVFEGTKGGEKKKARRKYIKEIKQDHINQGGVQKIDVIAGEINSEWVFYCNIYFKNNHTTYCSDQDTMEKLEKKPPENIFTQIKPFYRFNKEKGIFTQNFYDFENNLAKETDQSIIDEEHRLDFKDMIAMKTVFEENEIEVIDFPTSLDALMSGHYKKNTL